MFLKAYLTTTLLNILKLMVFFQITSMAFVRRDLLVIFCLTILISGLRLFRNINRLSCPLAISKAFGRVWHKALLAMLAAYGLAPHGVWPVFPGLFHLTCSLSTFYQKSLQLCILFYSRFCTFLLGFPIFSHWPHWFSNTYVFSYQLWFSGYIWMWFPKFLWILCLKDTVSSRLSIYQNFWSPNFVWGQYNWTSFSH